MANAIVEKAKERMTQSHQSLARELVAFVLVVRMPAFWIGFQLSIMEWKLHLIKSRLSRFLKRVSFW